jgi:hypothetical protein
MKLTSCHKHSKLNVQKQHCKLYDQCLKGDVHEIDKLS